MTQPELTPEQPDREQLLQQAWFNYGEVARMPQEVAGRMRQEFDEDAERRFSDLGVTPQQLEVLRSGKEFFKYFLFARPGDPLPDELAMYDAGDYEYGTDIFIGVKPDHLATEYHGYGAIYAVTDIIRDQILRAIQVTESTVDLDERRRRAIEVVKLSPVYDLLTAFDNAADAEVEPQKLSAYEKQVRVAQVYGRLCQEYGITKIQPLVDPDVSARFHAETWYLDDETASRKVESESLNATERLSQFFVEAAMQCLDEPERYIEKISYSDSQLLPQFHIRWVNRNKTVVEQLGVDDTLITHRTIVHILEKIGINRDKDTAQDIIGTGLLGSALKSLLNHNGFKPDYAWLADNANLEGIETRYFTRYLEDSEDGWAEEDFMCNIDSSQWHLPLQPPGEVLPANTYPGRNVHPLDDSFFLEDLKANNTADVVSAHSLNERQRKTIAGVERMDGKRDPHSRMVVFGGEIPTGLLADTSQADLRIKMFDSIAHSIQVQGYELVAIDANRGIYGLNRLPDDPYALDIPLSSDQTSKTYEKLTRVGLSSLARAVATSSSLRQIESAVRDFSDYTYDPKAAKDITRVSDVPRDTNGRPQVQCTGASQLMRSLLRAFYPSAEAWVQSGYVMEADSDRISAARHAQLVVRAGGQEVIFDATPSSRQSVGEKIMQLFNGSVSDQTASTRFILDRQPNQMGHADFEPAFSSRAELQNESRSQLSIGELRSQMEHQLIALTSVTNAAELKTKFTKYGIDDPVRKAYKLAYDLEHNQLDKVELEKAQSLVGAMLKNGVDPAVRRQHKLFPYDSFEDGGQAILQSVQRYLGDLAARL